MDRIATTFATARQENRACFISYVCAGDPDYQTSVEICRLLAENRVDLLEIGVPFSDLLADGPTNQLAAERALSSGMNHEKLLRLVKEVRAFTQKPIVLYTYFNLVFARGITTYVRELKTAGVDGLLTLDLPPEEAGELISASRETGLKNIFIVAPTTPPERVELITEATTGFIYYVSREGVTGEQPDISYHLENPLKTIRERTSLPVVVGFGISNASQVREVAAIADGVVVGSALVNCIGRNNNDREIMMSCLTEKLKTLTGGLF